CNLSLTWRKMMYENEKRECQLLINDGWILILPALALGIVGPTVLGILGLACLSSILGTLCFLFVIFMLWFFRNPVRVPPAGEENIVSGAEGTVRSVQYVSETDDVPAAEVVKEFFPGQRAVRISTFLSPLHVHVNRLSIGGKVTQCEYRHGKHLLTMDERSSLYNQHSVIVVEDKDGLRCLHKQITGPVVRRVVYWLEQDQPVRRGDILGMMKFGSRMDIWLPADRVEVCVKEGDPVMAGVTVIAKRK
ncbi:MAG: phosphatidylserine decarboxylase, partial [bacterium]|nr:phosphatidylserine decarboxylase [bacterium]